MKRFVTYLYEYDRGHKTKNVGFIKVDICNDEMNMKVCIRNIIRGNDTGEVFALVKSDNLIGVKIGEIKIIGNQGDKRFSLQGDNLMDSEYTSKDIVGIGIRLHNNGYLASCWNDEDALAVGSGAFSIYEKDEWIKQVQEPMAEESFVQAAQIEEPEEKEYPSVEECLPVEELEEQEWTNTCPLEGSKVYRKMELNQIHNLPSPNWHLCNNSFLVHGFFNYGYLILKKEIETEEEVLWLGVPGFFEKPEMVMAVLFGFTEFEAVPQEVAGMKMDMESPSYVIEKNQEPKTGLFGCWFVKLSK